MTTMDRTGQDGPSHASQSDADQVIYHVSHDVRASARALSQLPDWITADLVAAGLALPPDVANSLEMMRVHAARLDSMMRDLLEYSRIGRFQTPMSVNWNSVIDDVLAAHPLPEGFCLTRDLGAVSACLGPADADRLVQALLSNAVRHHDKPAGTILIETRASGGFCHLTVTDDGPGIAPALRPKALRLMATLRPRDEVEGSGVGLASVSKIAEFYGGSVSWPDVPAGRGLAILVSLPITPPAG